MKIEKYHVDIDAAQRINSFKKGCIDEDFYK